MPRPFRIRALVVLAFVALPCATPAWAGTVCGTIRDGLTTLPVARAGVFVRTTAGAYTGFYGASDLVGHFCIGGIPAGTYDLEVRLDDYQVAYRRGVVVTTDVTGVEIPTRFLESSLDPPTPNPARSRVQLRFRVRDAGPLELAVLDAQGRLLRGWSGMSAGQDDRSIAWDLRDRDGRPVPAGRYFVRLRRGDAALIRSFVRLP